MKFAGIFWCPRGPNFRPLSQWNLGDFFPNLKKKIQTTKKKQKKNIFFLGFSFSHHTHTSYMVTIHYHCTLFFFNLMAIGCVIANLFLN